MDVTYNHTKYMEGLVPQYSDIDPTSLADDFNDFEDFSLFLTEEELARPFCEGLTMLLEKPCSGYSGDLTNSKEKADYLYKQMRMLPSDVTKTTVKSWIEGKHAPSITPTTRQRMYEICFALHLSFEDVTWFFHHVYLDRSFNCHTIKEAVYCYCFQHQLPYSTALTLIQKVQNAPEPNTPAETIQNYTRFIREQLSSFQSEGELLHYLIANKHCFRIWNQTALSYIQTFLTEIKGPMEDKDSLDRLKKSLFHHRHQVQLCDREKKQRKEDEEQLKNSDNEINYLALCDKPKELQSYGLLLQELYVDSLTSSFDTVGEAVLDNLKQKQAFSNDFLLERLLGTKDGVQKNKQLPESIKRNFPSKMTMSAVLNMEKAQISESYDAIRKVLILLKFYIFWCKVNLTPQDYAEFSPEELTSIYLEETAALLSDCGYENLYAGNPYDFLFLAAAHNKISPLGFLRETVETLLNSMDEEENE